MAKDVNWTSQEWCDIVFDGKNKDYGAYKIRRTTSRRHTIAMIAVLVVAIFTAVLPAIVAKVGDIIERGRVADGLSEETKLVDVDNDEQEDKKNEVKPAELPPPPEKEFKFTPPVITESDKVTDDDRMHSQDELMDKKRRIGLENIQIGTDATGSAPDDDLRRNKNITNDGGGGDEPVRFVEQDPQFPGGMSEFYEFLRKNIVYPQAIRDAGGEGTSIIEFVVGKDGKVDRATVFRSSGYDMLDKEAVRVVKMMPRWVPGKVNGKAVASYYKIPIKFQLNQ